MGAPFLNVSAGLDLLQITYRDSGGPKRAKRAFWGEMGNLGSNFTSVDAREENSRALCVH